jgi:hypothetical protein
MQSRFNSTCKACGYAVREGDNIDRGPFGWVHIACVTIQTPIKRVDVDAPVSTAAVLPTLRDGIFTAKLDDGSHRTIRISTVARENEEEIRFVSLLTGPNNEADYNCVGYIKHGQYSWTAKHRAPAAPLAATVRAVVFADAATLHEMGVAYARESGNCYVCNRTLTTPESMEAGIGPVCARK